MAFFSDIVQVILYNLKTSALRFQDFVHFFPNCP